MVTLSKKLKMPQTYEKLLYKNIRFVVRKNRSKKYQIVEKWGNFENRPACKGYSPYNGYNLFRMVSLGEKLRMPKPCEKPFYENIKRLEKTPNIPEMREFWKGNVFTFLGLYLTQDPWDLVGLSTSDRCIVVCTLDEFC